jgi:cell division protein FtsB
MQGFAAIDPATANVDWRARATNLAADVERLTRERDEAQRENMDMVWQRRSAEFRAEAAEARIAKLEAALRSVEVEAVDLERRCSKLGHDRFSDHADAIAVIARAALKEPS